MKSFIVLFLLSIVNLASLRDLKSENDDDVIRLIEDSGYVGLSCEVETSDGYLLRLHKLKSSSKIHDDRNPVLLMHGLSATAADYVMTGPKKALAYMLVDNGYDVYLGNARGSKHSMKHRNLSIESKEFWNFSFHEIGIYDIAAMIDFILRESMHKQLFYVGHSQGTTSFLSLMSKFPEYQKKIIQGHLLAPAVFFSNIPNPFLKFIAGRADEYFQNHSYIKIGIFWKYLAKIRNTHCPQQSWKRFYCPELIFIYFQLFGSNSVNLELDLDVIWDLENHLSSRVGIKQVEHYSQMIQSKKFREFDYKENNTVFHNSTRPPLYDLRNVEVPIFLYAAERDSLVSIKDVADLQAILPRVKHFEIMKNYNHADVVYGKNCRHSFYTRILKFMNEEGHQNVNRSSET